MSDMGTNFAGFNDDGLQQTQQQQEQQPPKWYRDKLEADSKAMKEMQEALAALQQENRSIKIGREFESRGYAPGAAALFQGDPDKVDEWLTANAAFLVKQDGTTGAQPPAQTGPPASTLSTESQAGMQRMAGAGTSGTEQVLTGDAAVAAAIAACSTPEELSTVFAANGLKWDPNA